MHSPLTQKVSKNYDDITHNAIAAMFYYDLHLKCMWPYIKKIPRKIRMAFKLIIWRIIESNLESTLLFISKKHLISYTGEQILPVNISLKK